MQAPDEILKAVLHRPWPLPSAPWIMFQQWSDLLFAHSALPAEKIRPLVPEQLELDLFDGKAWVSVTPFRMTELHMRGIPAIPGTSKFLEMNLRTYVRQRLPGVSAVHPAPGHDVGDVFDKPGVFFFSLDADNLPAVAGARIGMGLPYFWSNMSATQDEERALMHYKSERKQMAADAEVKYTTNGDTIYQKTELDLFLTERYCLYEVRAGLPMRTEIQHIEWPLHHTKATFTKNTVGNAHNIPLTLKPDLTHFCRELDVLIYPPHSAVPA